jgi:hypothetical protein
MSMTPLRVWWPTSPKPGNMGDVLTPVILRALGFAVRYADVRSAHLIATGSIVRLARPGVAVWGSGAMFGSDRPTPNARYLAVRGPLTREVVMRAGGQCPEVYGDPALLLPRFHNGTMEKTHELGVVPHYRDRDHMSAGTITINPLAANPLVVVDRIRSCRSIVSSSLHGIIVAHAYGIPAAWIYSPRLNGDGTKFRDYAASVGVELVPHRTIEEAVPVLPDSIDTQPLLDALEVMR